MKKNNNDKDPAGKFKALAEVRTQRIIDDISRLKSLARRKNYEFTPEQVDKIFNAILAKCEEIRKAFEPQNDLKSLFKL